MKHIFICLILLLSVKANFAQYIWTQKSSLPIARYIGCGITLANRQYIGTGYDDNANAVSDWWMYDPILNSWTQKASMGIARASAMSFAIDGMGYVGFGLSGNVWLNDLYEYNPLANTWTPKASLPAAGRFGAASFTIGSSGYICCGNLGTSSGPYTNEVYAYDALTNSWTQKNSFPGDARYGMRGEALNNFGYVTGGTTYYNNTTVVYSDMWEYNPVTDSWSQKLNIPGPARNYASTFILDGKFVVGCGIEPLSFLNDFYAYDPSSNSWNNLPSLPLNAARWSAVGFSIGSAGYITTGNQSFNNPIIISNELWKLSLTTSQTELSNNHEIILYQNMLSEQLNIEVNIAPQQFSVEILNVNGQRCLKNIFNGRKAQFNTADLSNGAYFAVLSDNNYNRFACRKFIIHHK
jgi:N-acetylneuraminic acid mutarotase